MRLEGAGGRAFPAAGTAVGTAAEFYNLGASKPVLELTVPIPRVLLMGLPGPMELWIILIVVLIFFGNRIPGLARSLGSGISEFKSGLKEGEKPGSDSDDGDTKDSTDKSA